MRPRGPVDFRRVVVTLTQMSTEPTDAELARRVATGGSGAAEAFTRLRARYERRLLAYARTLFGPNAADVAAETWLRAFRWLSKPREVTNFAAWLFRVAENFGIDEARRDRPVPLDDHDPRADENDAPPARAIDTERRAALSECLASLKKQAPDQHAVVVAVFGGADPKQLAAEMKVERATIDTRKKRGLEALKKCMGGKLKEPTGNPPS